MKSIIKKRPKSVLISCFIAGVTEMYDFVIFGLLATIIHKNYLTFVNDSDSLLITYALFSVGFVFRPIGAFIFGYIGRAIA
jgi:MFS family permease